LPEPLQKFISLLRQRLLAAGYDLDAFAPAPLPAVGTQVSYVVVESFDRKKDRKATRATKIRVLDMK
jgi:hypothetical protein